MNRPIRMWTRRTVIRRWRRRLRWMWRLYNRLIGKEGRVSRMWARRMYRLCCRRIKPVLTGDEEKNLNRRTRRAGLSRGATHQRVKLEDSEWRMPAQFTSKRASWNLRSWIKRWKYPDSKTFQQLHEVTSTQLEAASRITSRCPWMMVKYQISKCHHVEIGWGGGQEYWLMKDK